MTQADELKLYESIHRIGVLVGDTVIVSRAAERLYSLGRADSHPEQWDDETVVESGKTIEQRVTDYFGEAS